MGGQPKIRCLLTVIHNTVYDIHLPKMFKSVSYKASSSNHKFTNKIKHQRGKGIKYKLGINSPGQMIQFFHQVKEEKMMEGELQIQI